MFGAAARPSVQVRISWAGGLLGGAVSGTLLLAIELAVEPADFEPVQAIEIVMIKAARARKDFIIVMITWLARKQKTAGTSEESHLPAVQCSLCGIVPDLRSAAGILPATRY